MSYTWIGKWIEGKLTLTHIPSGLTFNTWEDAKKWETLLDKREM